MPVPSASPVKPGISSHPLHPELLPEKKAKGGWKRSFNWAMAIFAAANIGLAQYSSYQQEKSAHNAGGDFWTNPALIDLAIKQFKEQKPPAKVVLLGSSLMMFPFWAMDAAFDKQIQDIAHHHKSVVLKAALEQIGLKNVDVFSLASAGQMSSDSFLYINEFLKGDQKPEVLVWGIAPRDFADDNVKSPMSTVSFKQIVDLHNFSTYSETFLPRFEDKAEFVANHSCFLYGRRWRFQKEADRTLEKVSQLIATQITGVKPLPASASADKPANDIASLLSGTAEKRWDTSKREYRGRYKNIGEKDLSVQIGALEKSLKICQERGIKVVLVNMPLTKINQNIMAEGFYDRFNEKVKAIAAHYGKDVTLVDMTHQSQFKDADFWDTVHMNHIGGSKLIGGIIPALRTYLDHK